MSNKKNDISLSDDQYKSNYMEHLYDKIQKNSNINNLNFFNESDDEYGINSNSKDYYGKIK